MFLKAGLLALVLHRGENSQTKGKPLTATYLHQTLNQPVCDVPGFLTDRSGQTVQTLIRLLLEEQSDQGLRCLLFHLHLLDEIPRVWPPCVNFR